MKMFIENYHSKALKNVKIKMICDYLCIDQALCIANESFQIESILNK